MNNKKLKSLKTRIKKATSGLSVMGEMILLYELETYSIDSLNTLKQYLIETNSIKGFENQLDGIINRVKAKAA
jgi:hypothetical protein